MIPGHYLIVIINFDWEKFFPKIEAWTNSHNQTSCAEENSELKKWRTPMLD